MASAVPANGSHVLRQMNRKAVLTAIRSATDVPRVAALTQATGLSRPAVTRAVTDLVDAGLVERLEASGAERTVGRPAQQVRFRSEAGFVAGLDVGPRRIHVVLADLDGTPITSCDVSSPPSGQRLVRAATEAISTCAASCALDTDRLWAIAVGTPGIVDPAAGRIRLAPSIPGWAGLPVVETLSHRYSCPVLIENDTNLAALAERSHGAAAGCTDFAYVHWDERVGTAIFVDGRPYRGASSAAGELGFLDLVGDLDRPPDSPRTAAFDGAGNFERLVGTAAIRELALTETAARGGGELHELCRGTDADRIAGTLYERADAGDDLAAAICGRVTSRFAAGLAAFLLLVDPEVVVLGGSVAHAGAPLLDGLRNQLGDRLFTVPRVVAAHLGDEAVAHGAIQHALGSIEGRIDDLCAATATEVTRGSP